MFTKKELITASLFIIFFAGIIYFLPTLEENISNRKIYEYEEKKENVKEIEKYICNFSSNSNVLKSIIEATFYINGDNVTRIYTKESKTYSKEQDYKSAVSSIEPNIETKDLEMKTTKDDLNYTIIIVKGQNIKEGTKVNYPTKYNELSEYLKKNNYTCTIRYKK